MQKYLEELENRISPEVEDALYNDWMDFIEGRFQGDIFLPARRRKISAQIEWPATNAKEAFDRQERMALLQFKGFSDALAVGSGSIMNIRANYGCGIMATLFGCELFRMEDVNTLPTSIPMPGGTDDVKTLLDKGVPRLDCGLGARVFETGAYYVELMKDYPKIRKYVHIYHPDIQGPLDVCELIWGSAMFVGLHDEPKLAKDFLALITDTYIAFMRNWLKIVPARGECSAHWGYLIKGQVMLRNDSAMNLSPEMYGEFGEPCDRRIIETFGGGAMHFCGRGDHYIGKACSIPGISAINMSQPQYNDAEKIYRNTVDKGIKLIGLAISEAEKALKQGRRLNSNVQSYK